MNNKIRTEAVSHLFEAILTLKTEEECFIFFEDLCTVNELLLFPRGLKLHQCSEKRHLSQDRGEDRSVHSDDQPCQSFTELWQ